MWKSFFSRQSGDDTFAIPVVERLPEKVEALSTLVSSNVGGLPSSEALRPAIQAGSEDVILSVLTEISSQIEDALKALGIAEPKGVEEYRRVLEELAGYNKRVADGQKLSNEELSRVAKLLKELEEHQDELAKANSEGLSTLSEVLKKPLDRLVEAEEAIASKIDNFHPREWLSSVANTLGGSQIADDIAKAVLGSSQFGALLIGISELAGFGSPLEMISKGVTATAKGLAFLTTFIGRRLSDLASAVSSGFSLLQEGLSVGFSTVRKGLSFIGKYAKLSYVLETKNRVVGVIEKSFSKLMSVLSLGTLFSLAKSSLDLIKKPMSKVEDMATGAAATSVAAAGARKAKGLFRWAKDKLGKVGSIFRRGKAPVGVAAETAEGLGLLSRFSGLLRWGGRIVGPLASAFDYAEEVKAKGAKEGTLQYLFGDKGKSAVGRATQQALRYSIIGGTIGSAIPGVGTVGGAVLGAGVGAVTGLIGPERADAALSWAKDQTASVVSWLGKKISKLEDSLHGLFTRSEKKEKSAVKIVQTPSQTTSGLLQPTEQDIRRVPVIIDDIGVTLLGSGLL